MINLLSKKTSAIVAAFALPVMLASCSALPPPGPLECNDSQRLCFRGNVLDRAATRQTYGIQALEDYDSMYSVF